MGFIGLEDAGGRPSSGHTVAFTSDRHFEPLAVSEATRIPDDHPRAASLRTRERMKDGVEAGLVHATGLIAHGRGEAFDYLLGERTPPEAARATAAAAQAIRSARQPVLSLNGNVVALAASAAVELQRAWPALRMEVNLFHRTPERINGLVAAMEAAGAPPGSVLGREPDARIPGLTSDRALCCKAGIGDADVVIVPLEDGDRCEALVALGKQVVTVDLNPLSRTARTAHITIVDELTRVLPALQAALAGAPGDDAGGPFDNHANLVAVRRRMAAHLEGNASDQP